MAKFHAAAFVVALSCLFALSLAGNPSENEDFTTTVVSLPIDPVNAESDSTSAVPLTTVSFRPVNRRFDVRSKRPCRHHHHHSKFYHAIMDQQHAQIPYGDDMILSTTTTNGNSELEERQTPGSRVRLHRHHHHDEDSDSDDGEIDGRIKKMVFKRYDFDSEKRFRKMRKHFRHENEEEKGIGFMNRMGNFFENYF